MSFKLQMFILTVTILFILYLLQTLKRDKVSLKYLLSWLFVSIIILLITIWPNILDRLSLLLGVYNPMNALFFLGFIFILSILFITTISQSRSSEKLKNIAQDIALKSYKIDKLNGENK